MIFTLKIIAGVIPASICQSAVYRHKNTCYWIEPTKDTFSGAEQKCVAHGGNLATVDSAEISQFLFDFVSNSG